MRMNEGFFGQYSVFCVFGSVVGCVVVPLIAQVLQQQSMECVILSAIVISLTAAHLNKKGGNDSTASYSKIVMASELERKKASHCKKSKTHTQHQHQHQHQQENRQMQMLTTAEQLQMELEHMQHREVYKTMEVERRAEEKRLKKLRKREERLKKREEETKKQKELDEHYRVVREKRVKQQKEVCYHQTQKNYIKSAAHNLDKYCGSRSDGVSSENKRCSILLTERSRVQPTCTTAPTAMKLRTLHSNNTPSLYNQQKIPRFERNRAGMTCCNHASLPQTCAGGGGCISSCESMATLRDSATNALTIKCNLSASCSSLSSISSLSSGSASPPMSAAAHVSNTTTPWSRTTPLVKQVDLSPPPANQSNGQMHSCAPVDEAHVVKYNADKEMENSLKAYSSSHLSKPAAIIPRKFIPGSSSLFCSQLDGKVDIVREGGGQSQPVAGSEYSLFGPRGFVTSLAR